MIKRITSTLPPNKPFLLLEGKSQEFLTALGISLKYPYICPRCGTPVVHSAKVIYVAVDNQILCCRCAESWLAYARWYSDEEKKEKDNYEEMVQKLKDSKLWEE